MGQADHYRHGDSNAICDACGFKYKFSQLRKRWDGLYVCSKDFEIRQPQDFVRGRVDRQVVPVSRPEASDVFIDPAVSAANSLLLDGDDVILWGENPDDILRWA